MAISKKQAKQIASLINSCTVWSTSVNAVLDTNGTPEYDGRKVRRFMGYHDRDAQALNDLLGVQAVCLYQCNPL